MISFFNKFKFNTVIFLVVFSLEIFFIVILNANKEIQGISFNLQIIDMDYPGSAGDSWYSLYRGGYFAQLTDIPSSETWIARLWPPGMPFWYALISIVSFHSTFVPLIHVIFIIFIWVFISMIPLFKAQKLTTKIFGLIFALYLLTSMPVRNWILGYGIFYSEGLSIAAFLIGISLGLSKSQFGSKYFKHKLILSGLFIAFAGSVRTIFAFSFELAIIIVATITLMNNVIFKKKNSYREIYKKSIFILLGYMLLSLPLHIDAFNQFRSLTYTDGISQTWKFAWTETKEMNSRNLNAYVGYGVNGFCESYPLKCSELNKNDLFSYSDNQLYLEALSSISSNPLPFIINRLEVVNNNFIKSYDMEPFHYLIWIIPFGIAFIHLFISKFLYKKSIENMEFVNLSVSVVLLASFFSVVVLIPSGFEPRYGFPIFFIICFTSALLFVDQIDQGKKYL
jgi:hypothetical protein